MSRNTGFSPKVREMILERAGGMCEGMVTEECTSRIEAIHHRKPRKMGGSKRPDINAASNGLALCADCHDFIESNRAYARSRGLLISQHSSEPVSCVGVWRRGVWVLLTDAGGVVGQAVPF